MKKILALLLALLLLLGSGTTVFAKNSKHFPQSGNTMPEYSEYKFSYTFLDYILAGKETVVDVAFQTKTLGEAGYEDVHFEFSADCLEATGGEVVFSASDGTTTYSFTNFGMWGPAGGFDLPADYDETTEWTLEFSEAGEYEITFQAIGKDDLVIAEGREKVLVEDAVFLYEVPENIIAGEEIEVEVSFVTSQDYDDVSFRFSADGPGDVVFEAMDSDDSWHTFTNTGNWGSGFDISGDYEATTTWFITFTEPGSYEITFELIDNNDEVLVSGAQAVNVKSGEDDEEENENSEGGNGNTHGLMNALRNHLKIRGNGHSQARVNSIQRLMQLLQERGVDIKELEEAIDELTAFIENDGCGSNEDFKLLGKMYQKKGNKYETFINGKRTKFDVPPLLKEGRTLVPFRKIAEELSAEVSWNSTKQLVIVKKGETTIELAVNSNTAMVNGKSVPLDVPAQLHKNRTMIPLRFVAEALDTTVDYYTEGSLIVIKKKDLR